MKSLAAKYFGFNPNNCDFFDAGNYVSIKPRWSANWLTITKYKLRKNK